MRKSLAITLGLLATSTACGPMTSGPLRPVVDGLRPANEWQLTGPGLCGTTDKWRCVAEDVADDDRTFVHSHIAGAQQVFGLGVGDLPEGVSVVGLRVFYRAVGEGSLALLAGAEASAPQPLAGEWAEGSYYFGPQASGPLVVGVVLVEGRARVTQLWAEADYLEGL